LFLQLLADPRAVDFIQWLLAKKLPLEDEAQISDPARAV
jgi:hypothetical protein